MTQFLPLLLLATAAHAQEPAKPEARKILWDNWYTMTSGKTPYGYYNEKVELRGEKIHFQNKLWKKEEGFINEEQLGTIAESKTLKPMFFNFHSNYRGTETNIDGSVSGNVLTVKVRRAKEDLPAVKRTISSKAIFSQFFPVWLGQQLQKGVKTGKEISFSAILEDNLEAGFSPVSGSIRIEKPDDRAATTKTRKILVDYQGAKSHWWVESNGAPIRIEMKQHNITVERATPEKAQKFLSTEE